MNVIEKAKRWGSPTMSAVHQAKHWAATEATPAIAGSSGHRQTYSAACWVRKRFGLSEPEILAVLVEAYNPRCEPPWSEADLRHKARDAAKIEPDTRPMKRHREPRGRELTPAEKRATWPIRWIDDTAAIEKACAYLSEERGIPVEGVQLARWAGILRFGVYQDPKHGALKFWALTTPDGRLCEGRRINGQLWPARGEPTKSKKFWGSEGALIGEHLLGSDLDPVLLVEGGPDYLAACFLARRAMDLDSNRVWIPMAFLGSGNHFDDSKALHCAALHKLAGRTVHIIADSDDAGRKAARKWSAQLRAAGADDKVLYAGNVIKAAKDLNDIFTMGEPEAVENFIREAIQ